MADDERCSPVVDFDASINSTSTMQTVMTTSELLFILHHDVNDVTTASSSVTLSNDVDYSRVSTEKRIEEALYKVVIVIVCVIGLACNIVNLLVLSRKSLTATMERLERSAHYGLVGKNFTQTRLYIVCCQCTRHCDSIIGSCRPS